jgi:protease IV
VPLSFCVALFDFAGNIMTSTDQSPDSPQNDTSTRPAVASAMPSHGSDEVLKQFALNYIKDRRSERRWRIFFRFCWLLLFIGVAAAIFNSQHTGSAPSGPHTALVELRGEISSGGESSAERMVSALQSAFEDTGAVAVVMRVNSPGGSPVQAGIIYDEIRRLKAQHNKKFYVVVEEVCASAAYYIASAADEIYVDKASIVGSIGVLMDSFGFTGLMEKLGIERRLLTAGDNKGFTDPFSPQTEEHKAFIQVLLKDIHQQFITAVQQGRGKRIKQTPEIFSGLFWTGDKAIELGLADKFGNLGFVAREVIKAEEIIDYTPTENVAERLAKRFGAAMGAGAVSALQSRTGQLQ